MRWLFIERDNVTHPSDPDSDGNSYTASFEFFPFHEGATFSVYKGILNGDARRRGEFCVVKSLVEKPAGLGELDHVIERAREAQRLADLFNNFIGYRAVGFAIPALARLKHVSDFNGLFRCIAPHDKRLVCEEYVVVEALIEGAFQRFNSNNGSISSEALMLRRKRKSKDKKRNKRGTDLVNDTGFEIDTDHMGSNNLAQAFGHYVWYVTGTTVVCGLEGVFGNSCYLFTTPVIHSLASSFGVTDGGPDAIAQFFAAHRCTNVCQQWPVYSPQNSNCKKQVNFFQSDSKLSYFKSAIPDKNIFNGTLDIHTEKR